TQAEGDGRYRQTATALTDADIPAAIARDAEVTAVVAAHVAAADPHPVYLTQAEGDGRYRQTATALVDADIPAAIARDAEVTAAVAAHVAAADPHPVYLTQAEGDGRYSPLDVITVGGYAISRSAHCAFHKPTGTVQGQDRYYFRRNTGTDPLDKASYIDLFVIADNGICFAANGFANLSDSRLKSGITPLSYGLSEILNLSPCSYFLNIAPRKRKMGLVAQEVLKIIPEAVIEPQDDKDAYHLDYLSLIPVLINAIQELKAQINRLDAKAKID
ncbi:tail fiber domain-containing protein, partial [Microcoleus anatoxicus]|uniref:tail fiber domain-containing protein n=1 Tax=Microcoleus anatoxicus TaxID=2705319 RepID=UPI0030C90C9E